MWTGRLRPGVYAKDVILHIIAQLGAKGGIGYAYEYGGDVFDRFSMEERMTVCNMSIEGGARCGYVNPDEKTFAYLEGPSVLPRRAPMGRGGANAGSRSPAMPTPSTTTSSTSDAEDIAPTVTWGISPDQGFRSPERSPIPRRAQSTPNAPASKEALEYMKLARRRADQGHEDRRRLRRLLHQRPPE